MKKARLLLSDQRNFAMSLSIVIAFLMLAGKIAAYILTSSNAIFSDAAESVVHLFAIGIASFSLWYSQQPANKEYKYGHGKIAYLSAAGEAIVILGAAVSIIYLAFDALIHGSELQDLGFGIMIILALAFVNYLLGNYLIRIGNEHNSFILIANGKHILTDMWTSLGVVIGVSLVWVTGISWLDPVAALLVGLHITWTAVGLLKQSYQGIMEKVDAATDREITRYLDSVVQDKTICSYHELRHRKVNDRLWIEFHLLFPPEISLKDAHDISCYIEVNLIKAFPKETLHITTHLEPTPHDESHPKGHPENLGHHEV